MDSLSGQVAPVTGSSRGIGAAIAAEFARAGAVVAEAGGPAGSPARSPTWPAGPFSSNPVRVSFFLPKGIR
jgi:hypothetical protein